MGDDKIKKSTALDKAVHGFISTDSSKLGDYLLNDIIVPSLKDTISKLVKGGIDTLLYGFGGSPSQKKSGTSNISYQSFYNNQRNEPRRSSHEVYEYRDVTFDSRDDAEKTIRQLMDVIDAYGRASVAQYFELAQITPNPNDYNYGWQNLVEARPYRTLSGLWKIEMPQAGVLKRN